MSSQGQERADLRVERGRQTRAQLVASAAQVLAEEGFAGMTMRAVAERAQAQLSLVHYHFGSKHKLLLAVLDDLTAGLLERQQAMFADGRPFADQWRTACEYLREDVRSGYVRILWELWAAGLTTPELAVGWRATQDGWRALLATRLERWVEEKGVELPMSPAALAFLMGSVFEGIEAEILAGAAQDGRWREALEACGALIAAAEDRTR